MNSDHTNSQISLSQLRKMLVDGYAIVNEQIDSGYMLVDNQFNIVFANQYCHKHFETPADNQPISCIELFKKLNQNAVKLMNPNIYNASNVLSKNNKMIEKEFQVTSNA
jgi:hypothetical protein